MASRPSLTDCTSSVLSKDIFSKKKVKKQTQDEERNLHSPTLRHTNAQKKNKQESKKMYKKENPNKEKHTLAS